MQNNLPPSPLNKQLSVKEFFNTYSKTPVSFPAAEIDATIAFFVKRGFDQTSATSTAITILNQARIENIPVFQLLDTLRSLTDIQLSQIVAQILNSYREQTSLLGYRSESSVDSFESRNILI